jgi:hypothetical protein
MTPAWDHPARTIRKQPAGDTPQLRVSAQCRCGSHRHCTGIAWNPARRGNAIGTCECACHATDATATA